MSTLHINKLNQTDWILCKKLRDYIYDVIGCCQSVHREMGPYLNEYMYQDALKIVFEEQHIEFEKEYYFSVYFHNQIIRHKHFVDFKCRDNIFIECKAIENLGVEQRQQLWNYMRLTNTPIGILYNFAPLQDECERYYYDVKTKTISMF